MNTQIKTKNIAESLDLTKRLDDIKKNIALKSSEGQEQKENMQTIQKKLAKSHEITLRLVIDVSTLLKKYQDYFDKLDDQIKSLNIGFSREEGKYLSAFADTSMTDLTNSFEKHLNFLKRYYETNGLSNSSEMARLRALENLHSTLVTDVKYLDPVTSNSTKIAVPVVPVTIKNVKPESEKKGWFGGNDG
jgi:hypothetical protein